MGYVIGKLTCTAIRLIMPCVHVPFRQAFPPSICATCRRDAECMPEVCSCQPGPSQASTPYVSMRNVPRNHKQYVLHLLVANHQPTTKSTETIPISQGQSSSQDPPRCQRMHLHAIHCARNVDHDRSPSNTSRIKCWPTPAMLHSRPATGGPLLRPCFIKTAL